MPQLVVTCHPNGSVETLLKDKVFDTRKLGDREVERLSIIEHDAASQRFYIQWLKGPRAGEIEMVPTQSGPPSLEIRTFDTYEDAVAYEVAQVNKMRLAGYSFRNEW